MSCHRSLRGSFWLNLTENIIRFEYENGIGPNKFIVQSLKWACLRLTTNVFSGIWCIPLSQTSYHRFLEGLFGWIWLKPSLFLNIKTEECDLKVLLLIYWNGLALGSIQTDFLEVGAYLPLERATGGFWRLILLNLSEKITIL